MYVVSQEERGEEREEREVRIRRRRRWSNNKNPILRIWGIIMHKPTRHKLT